MNEERVIVTRAEYVLSAVNKSQYPEENLPEIAFIGRSNVGKSSLINSLTRRKNLARISQTPGKTQTINFYKVSLKFDSVFLEEGEENPDAPKNYERRNFYLVDLPGYGYAKTSKTNRELWAKFIDEYFLKSPALKFVCLLVDMRHPPQDSDIKMLENLFSKNLPVVVVATKSDKLRRNDLKKNLNVIKKTFGTDELPVIPYSSIKNEGRSFLLDVIVNSLIE